MIVVESEGHPFPGQNVVKIVLVANVDPGFSLVDYVSV